MSAANPGIILSTLLAGSALAVASPALAQIGAGVGASVGGVSAGVGASVGGGGGISAGAGASAGGHDGGGVGAGAGASVGGSSGVNAGAGASIGGGNGVNAGVGASVGGGSGADAGVSASLGGRNGIGTNGRVSIGGTAQEPGGTVVPAPTSPQIPNPGTAPGFDGEDARYYAAFEGMSRSEQTAMVRRCAGIMADPNAFDRGLVALCKVVQQVR
ncbi:hypothetical protein [Aurantimonas coralicida]|uniref:hypothetical protein n=1 Tax=Aurantimonas coralicida TaxID=182270 RepID=UPI00239CB0EA|nr:hypothetical protein [Aurantimonas coralicida]MDE0924517.1 hypothetical protein [Aurantimonas coralicida]